MAAYTDRAVITRLYHGHKVVIQRSRELERDYRSNRFWADRLSDKFLRKENPLDILLLDGLVARTTPARIVAAARTFLRNDQYFNAELVGESGGTSGVKN